MHKVPVGGATDATADSYRGRPFMQRIVEEKKAEMKEYMRQVGHVIALYMPPNPQKMEQAFKARKVFFARSGGQADLVFRNYALPGDSMTIGFDTATRKIRSLNVHSYLDSPQDAITLKTEFASLSDGTNHPLRMTLNAQGKDIHVVNTNTNYRKTSQF